MSPRYRPQSPAFTHLHNILRCLYALAHLFHLLFASRSAAKQLSVLLQSWLTNTVDVDLSGVDHWSGSISTKSDICKTLLMCNFTYRMSCIFLPRNRKWGKNVCCNNFLPRATYYSTTRSMQRQVNWITASVSVSGVNLDLGHVLTRLWVFIHVQSICQLKQSTKTRAEPVYICKYMILSLIATRKCNDSYHCPWLSLV